MANEKISQLPTVTNAAVGSTSIIPIVDSTDSTTKTIALDQLDERWIPQTTMTTEGDFIYGGASGAPTRLPAGAAGQILQTNSNSSPPSWRTITAPTVQKFLSTGTTTGYLFTVSSANATVGATYTNNGNTYTVLGTISAGTQLFCSGASAPTSSGTLTKASGTGDTTITFSAETPLATYTTPTNPAPLYIRVRMVGGGGGGSSSSASGSNGTNTIFGVSLLTAGFGQSGGSGADHGGGGGGSVTINSPAIQIVAANGSDGLGAMTASSAGSMSGPAGASSYFGGVGATRLNPSSNSYANSGCGGSGEPAAASALTGTSGGAGGYLEAQINQANLASSYPYIIGLGGAGTSNAGSGGSGRIVVEEYYQ